MTHVVDVIGYKSMKECSCGHSIGVEYFDELSVRVGESVWEQGVVVMIESIDGGLVIGMKPLE